MPFFPVKTAVGTKWKKREVQKVINNVSTEIVENLSVFCTSLHIKTYTVFAFF